MHAIPTPSELSVSISESHGRSFVTAETEPPKRDPATGAEVYVLDRGVKLEFHKSGRTVIRGPETDLRALGMMALGT